MSEQNRTAEPLEQYRWQNRLLLVFYPSAGYDQVRGQRTLVESHRAGFADRDLLTFYLPAESSEDAATASFSPPEVSELRRKHSVEPSEFVVLLIGKDGTVKARFDQPVPVHDLFARIDAMPMRIREMQAGREAVVPAVEPEHTQERRP